MGDLDDAVTVHHEARVEAAAAVGVADGAVGLGHMVDEIHRHGDLEIRLGIGLHPSGALGPLGHLIGDGVRVLPAQIAGLVAFGKGVLLGVRLMAVHP